MTFQIYYQGLSKDEKEQLAERAQTSVAYLYQVATDRRRAGLSLALRLIAADDRISLEMLRPDLVQAA